MFFERGATMMMKCNTLILIIILIIMKYYQLNKIRVRTVSFDGTQRAAFLSSSHFGAGKLYNSF
jgi:uncharacterized membrane protein